MLNNAFLSGAVRLKKGQSRFSKIGSPWVYSNELEKIDASIAPGSWVVLEGADGQAVAYGHFNPHSLISFRAFERAAFRSESQTRALFFKRLDWAWVSRQRAFGSRIASGDMGRHSFRLAFGESDAVPGLVVDLFERGAKGFAVAQCHSAGADRFLIWLQQWLEERMGISAGLIRNDLEVRKKENAKLEVVEWGAGSGEITALEGGVKFIIDAHEGQKTGYFYDLRDCRAEFASRVSQFKDKVEVLDCFSYVGSWGLQALKRNPKARLTAVDVSAKALESLKRNAEANGMGGRVECVEADFFKAIPALAGRSFNAVVCDPPSLTSSAKQAQEGLRAHEKCFFNSFGLLAEGGIAALASCSFHLSPSDFATTVSRAALSRNRYLRMSYFGSQSADHPVLSTLPESEYIKCVIVEEIDRWQQS